MGIFIIWIAALSGFLGKINVFLILACNLTQSELFNNYLGGYSQAHLTYVCPHIDDTKNTNLNLWIFYLDLVLDLASRKGN